MDREIDRSLAMKKRMGIGAALLFILLLAAWLRFDGLGWQLPFRLHPDEWKYVAGGAECHLGKLNPKYFRNPPGFSYLNAVWFPVWLKIDPPVEIPAWLGADPIWTKPSDRVDAAFLYRPFDLVLGARALSALLGVITCGVVFLLARRFMSDAWATCSALLVAVSFAHVRESHIAVNDVCMTLFATLAVWMGVRSFRSGRRRDYFIATALAGIAIVMKYNAVAAFVAVLGLRVLAFGKRVERNKYPVLLGDLALGGAIAAGCFLVICPFPILDPKTFWEEIGRLGEAASQTWPGQDTSWTGLQMARVLWISEGAVSIVFSIAGLAVLLRKRTWEAVIFPVCYILLVLGHPLFFMRFSLPVLPWMAIFCVMGISTIVRMIKESRIRTVISILLVCLCMAEPLAKDLRGNWLMKRTDTRVQCLEWFLSQERTRTLVAADQYVFPLVYRRVSEFWSRPFDPRQVSIDSLESKDLTRLDTLSDQVKTGIVTISAFAAFPGYIPDTYPERRRALMEFCGTDTPVKIFQPFTDDWEPQAADVEDTYAPISKLWRRSRPGPVIEVFRRGVK